MQDKRLTLLWIAIATVLLAATAVALVDPFDDGDDVASTDGPNATATTQAPTTAAPTTVAPTTSPPTTSPPTSGPAGTRAPATTAAGPAPAEPAPSDPSPATPTSDPVGVATTQLGPAPADDIPRGQPDGTANGSLASTGGAAPPFAGPALAGAVALALVGLGLSRRSRA